MWLLFLFYFYAVHTSKVSFTWVPICCFELGPSEWCIVCNVTTSWERHRYKVFPYINVLIFDVDKLKIYLTTKIPKSQLVTIRNIYLVLYDCCVFTVLLTLLLYVSSKYMRYAMGESKTLKSKWTYIEGKCLGDCIGAVHIELV